MENKGINWDKWEKWIAKVFVAAFVLVMAGVVLTQTFSASERQKSQLTGKIYSGEWYVFKDGKRTGEALSAPFQLKLDGSGSGVVGTLITEEMARNGAIGIATNRYRADFLVDDELREEYNTEDTRLLGKYDPVYLGVIRLYPEDAGKTFFVKIYDNGTGTFGLDNVYAGTELGIWYYIIQTRMMEVIASFFLLIMSGSSIVAGSILYLTRKKGRSIIYIASSMFLISIWSITQSAYRFLIFRNVSIISNMPFIALTLVPVTLLLYFNDVQNARYRRLELPLALFGVVNLIVQFLLHWLEIVDYSRSIYVTFVYLFVCIFAMDYTMILDVKNGKYKSYFWVATGVVVVQFTGVIQILRYILVFSDHSSGFINVGIIFLFLMSLIKTIQDTLENDRKRIEAENASRMKEEFLAGMSHEIRTPLNAVLGLNDMIVETTKEQKTLEYALDVKSAGKSLLAIINDVLDFSKINTGQVELVETEYLVTALINDCYNVVNRRAADKKLEFKVWNDESMPAGLVGDEARIRQIIINIINNAIKYTQKGSVVFRLGWEDRGEKDQGILIISVKDTGIGIRGEDRERIYESFTRLEKLKNRKVEGTGLGLAITKKLVDAMEGKISFQSDYGIGTEFTVEIPQKIYDSTPAGKFRYHSMAHDVAGEFIGYDVTGIRALVVDDNELNRKVAVSMLLSIGLEVETAADGDECINMVRNERYDIIFLDHMMPGKDGVETLKEMRDSRENYLKDTPVIMLTANAVAGAKEEYQAYGFADYLAKPFKKQELIRVLMENVKRN